MKLRLGFVSNSSSSSFILKLPKPITEYSLEQFKEYLKVDPNKWWYRSAQEVDKGMSELYTTLQGKNKFLIETKDDNIFEIVVGDLCTFENVGYAYSLLQDYKDEYTQLGFLIEEGYGYLF